MEETIAQKILHQMMLPDAPPEKRPREEVQPPKPKHKRQQRIYKKAKTKASPQIPPTLQPWMKPKLHRKQLQNGPVSNMAQGQIPAPSSPISICSSPEHEIEDWTENLDSDPDEVVELEDESNHSCQDDIPSTSSKTNPDIEISDWRTENIVLDEESNSDCNKEQYELSDLKDSVNIPSAQVHEELPPSLHKWLVRQDEEIDRLLRFLLPPHLRFEWTHDPGKFTATREAFTKKSGPTFIVRQDTRPIDVFLKYYDNYFFELLTEVTCKNALLIDQNHYTIVKSEITIFVAILILQGVAHFLVDTDNWGENGYLTLKYFRTLLSPTRFELIKKSLRIYNKDDSETESRDDSELKKMQPLLNLLKKKYTTLYYPGQDVIVDESLLEPQTRSFAQRVSAKARHGVKAYALTDAKTGYLWDFFVYNHADRKSQAGTIKPDNPTARILHELIDPLLNRGHTVILDNYFNSPLLARYLKLNGTDCYGSLRNRANFPESFDSNLKHGEFQQSVCDDLHATMWRESNLISMLSTFQDVIISKEENQWSQNTRKIVEDYKLALGILDKKDETLAEFSIEMTDVSPCLKLFTRLLNVTLHNAYIIYKNAHPNATHRQFRKEIAEELIKIYKPIESDMKVNIRTYSKGRLKKSRPILEGNHYMGLGECRTRRCVWCVTRSTRYICKQCDVALCMLHCFEEYHTVENQTRRID